MNGSIRSLASLVVLPILLAPHASFSQSLSSQLGATNLDGLKNYNECQAAVAGYHEQLIASRLEQKLAVSGGLTDDERGVWSAEIAALRAVTREQPIHRPPDKATPYRYLDGLTRDEQIAINSMNVRNTQEINLQCEQKFGGMTRFSQGGPGPAQRQYEEQLRANMQTPIDVATIAVEALPSPFPKSAAEIAAERKAAEDASRQAAMGRIASCADAAKGLRLSIMADRMQENLANAQGLSAQERADFEADILATRESAAKGLEQVEPVDPANPYRAMMRLTTQDQMDVAMDFGKRYAEQLASCNRR